ncbi:MAG: DUF86 domain-containing protein [Caldilineaceae bacterium]
MYSEREERFLQDIVEAINRIQSYVADIDYDEFQTDSKTQDAVIRNLEIIGEASKQISDEVRQQAALIPWRNIARMRDKLIHHYFGINLDIIWQVIQDDLPPLMMAVSDILAPPNDSEYQTPK